MCIHTATHRQGARELHAFPEFLLIFWNIYFCSDFSYNIWLRYDLFQKCANNYYILYNFRGDCAL